MLGWFSSKLGTYYATFGDNTLYIVEVGDTVGLVLGNDGKCQ